MHSSGKLDSKEIGVAEEKYAEVRDFGLETGYAGIGVPGKGLVHHLGILTRNKF
jgi:hypothetical protein